MSRDEMMQVVSRLDREGGFAWALGQALLLADSDNQNRLVQAFPEIFKHIRLAK